MPMIVSRSRRRQTGFWTTGYFARLTISPVVFYHRNVINVFGQTSGSLNYSVYVAEPTSYTALHGVFHAGRRYRR
jgi:hypothetical protein